MSVIDNLLSHYVTYCTDCISQMFINGYKWVTTTFLLATKLQICADATAWQRATLGCSSPCQAHRTTTCCIPTTTAVIISLYSGYHQHKNYSHISVRSDNATIWCSAQSYQVIRRLLCNTVLGKLVSKINCFIKCSFKYGFCKLLLTIRLCYSNSKMSPLPSAVVKLLPFSKKTSLEMLKCTYEWHTHSLLPCCISICDSYLAYLYCLCFIWFFSCNHASFTPFTNTLWKLQ